MLQSKSLLGAQCFLFAVVLLVAVNINRCLHVLEELYLGYTALHHSCIFLQDSLKMGLGVGSGSKRWSASKGNHNIFIQLRWNNNRRNIVACQNVHFVLSLTIGRSFHILLRYHYKKNVDPFFDISSYTKLV